MAREHKHRLENKCKLSLYMLSAQLRIRTAHVVKCARLRIWDSNKWAFQFCEINWFRISGVVRLITASTTNTHMQWKVIFIELFFFLSFALFHSQTQFIFLLVVSCGTRAHVLLLGHRTSHSAATTAASVYCLASANIWVQSASHTNTTCANVLRGLSSVQSCALLTKTMLLFSVLIFYSTCDDDATMLRRFDASMSLLCCICSVLCESEHVGDVWGERSARLLKYVRTCTMLACALSYKDGGKCGTAPRNVLYIYIYIWYHTIFPCRLWETQLQPYENYPKTYG